VREEAVIWSDEVRSRKVRSGGGGEGRRDDVGRGKGKEVRGL